jgi:hypothetical protein
MSATAEKARALRLERLGAMISTRLEHPPAALETLSSELKLGEARPELWEGLHAAAARDGKEAELAEAYQKFTSPRRLQQFPPNVQADVLMHAANFYQGVLGDREGAESFLDRVLEVIPGHAEAFGRLERKFEGARDNLGLAELYATVAAAPPKPPEELARSAVNTVALLPAKTPLSDQACRQLVALAPASLSVLDVLVAHCQKTGRVALGCELVERAIAEHSLPSSSQQALRRRLIELYLGESETPAAAMDHVEALLSQDASDATARAAAERLLSTREVASRAAAALRDARNKSRSPG